MQKQIMENKIFSKEACMSYLQIAILIIASFAFAYIIYKSFEFELLPEVSAETGMYTCLEDKEGNLCKEYPLDSCNENCKSTCFPGEKKDFSECTIGCCFNPNEGTCSVNSPKAECEKYGGEFDKDSNCNLQKCEKGCCVLGSETSFVTEKKCEVLTGSQYQKIFLPEIKTEPSCLILAEILDRGACILGSDEGVNACKFATRGECLSLTGDNSKFFKDKLCTNPELNTACEKTEQTTCVEGRDEVYFLDSCGNPANIYDSSKINNEDYWKNVIAKENSCALEDDFDNANKCGNCNYVENSRCKAYEPLNDVKPNYGNSVCRDLNCYDAPANGGGKEDRKNFESWCVFESFIGEGKDVVGSRHFKYSCIEGEVQVEPCADFRNEICVESQNSEVDFSSASCRINNWQKCINTNSNPELKCDGTDCKVTNINVDKGFTFDVCTPKYPEGFDIKNERSMVSAGELCGIGTQTCTVIYVKDMKGKCKCVQNCNCEKIAFTQQMNELCTSLGDCGGYVNTEGVYTDEGYTVSGAPKITNSYSQYASAVAGQIAEPGTLEELINDLIGFQEQEGTESGEGGGSESSSINMGIIAAGAGTLGVGWLLSQSTSGCPTCAVIKFLTGGGSAGSLGEIGGLGTLGQSGSTIAFGSKIKAGTDLTGTITEWNSEYGRYVLTDVSGKQYFVTSGSTDLTVGEQFTAYGWNAVPIESVSSPALEAGAELGAGAAEDVLLGGDVALSLEPAASVTIYTPETISIPLETAGIETTYKTGSLVKFTNPSLTEPATLNVPVIEESLASIDGSASLISGDVMPINFELAVEDLSSEYILADPVGTGTAPWQTGYSDLEIVDAEIGEGVTAATPPSIFTAFTNLLMVTGIIMTIAPMIASMLGIQTSPTGMIAGTVAGVAATYITAAYMAAQTGAFTVIGADLAATGAIAYGQVIEAVMLDTFSWGGFTAFGVGIIVAVAVMALFQIAGIGKICKKVQVTYTCKPWQPPAGGSDCEKCNEPDENNPLSSCSKYKCQSLGQACEFLNEGTNQEMCIAEINDGFAPRITPYYDFITQNITYEDVSDFQFKLKNNEDEKGCVQEFTPVAFGITTDEPSQCKIDVAPGNEFGEMLGDFGGTNMLLYNHTMVFSLPGAESIANEYGAEYGISPEIILDKLGDLNFYVKCRDSWGNINTADLTIKLCVKEGPDKTAPYIRSFSPPSNSFVKYGETEKFVKLWLNEPAECKYSYANKNFDAMENSMECVKSLEEQEVWGLNYGYACNFTMRNLNSAENKIFIKCKDKPLETDESKRITMDRSVEYILKSSPSPLKIDFISPSGEISSGTEPVSVILEAHTSGGSENGNSVCRWKIGIYEDTFFNTASVTHTSPGISLLRGTYNLEVFCEDGAFNTAQNLTRFTINVDTSPPVVTRVFYDGSLKIMTSENSICGYSFRNCNFEFNDNTTMMSGNTKEHDAEWSAENTYYIKCKDAFDNCPSSCSIIVRPYNI